MVKCLLLFLAGGVTVASAQSPALKVRQVVIRAPSAAVASIAFEQGNDQAFADALWNWVKQGKARVVSEVQKDLTALDEGADVSVGKPVDWASERDQDFENLILEPTKWQTTLVGTSMQVTSPDRRLTDQTPNRLARWVGVFSPRGPVHVEWPLVWPINKVPRVAWLDEPDFFQEKIETAFWQPQAGTTVLAIAPPADALEPGSPNKAFTDVILGETTTDKLPVANLPEVSAKRRPPSTRLSLAGIAVRDTEALAILGRRDPGGDPALFAQLLKKVEAGGATLRTCCATTLLSGERSTMESGRQHRYPVEMPTFPSAWEARTVGAKLEAEYNDPDALSLAFSRHPALPRRAEWRCAVDAPEMVMWQPQFFLQSATTTFPFETGQVHLIAVMRQPDLLTGIEGLAPGETLLLFGRREDAPSGPATTHPVPRERPNAGVEIETIVFDLPASEQGSWQAIKAGTEAQDRFDQLLARVQKGSAKIAHHVAVSTAIGDRAAVEDYEEVVSVTEGEPDYTDVPGRYRPTACERTPLGIRWSVDVSRLGDGENAHRFLVQQTLDYDTQRPRPATLEEMIAFSKNNNDAGLPPVERFIRSSQSSLTVTSGQAHFVEVTRPPGDQNKDRVHVRYLRARLLE